MMLVVFYLIEQISFFEQFVIYIFCQVFTFWLDEKRGYLMIPSRNQPYLHFHLQMLDLFESQTSKILLIPLLEF